MATSHLPSSYPTTIQPSTNFLESCGCILFDFRGTPIDPFSPSRSSTTSQPPSTASSTTTQQPKIILFYSNPRQHHLLPKGRRNVSEPRGTAALRETYEETGLKCSLLPITLDSRATSVNPADDRTSKDGYTIDEVRTFERVTDPFMVVLRETKGRGKRTAKAGSSGGENDPTLTDAPVNVKKGEEVMKMIWWFVGVVDEEQGGEEGKVEIDPGCEVVSVPMDEAAGRCSFEDDAKVVAAAVEIVKTTFGL